MEQLQAKIQTMMLENSTVPGPSPGEIDQHRNNNSSHHHSPHEADDEPMDKLGELEQAETPTDVRDIHF
jgi:hypothetical protein